MIVYLQTLTHKPTIMKPFFSSVFLILLSALAFGQLEKGKCFLQGSSSMGFSSEKYTYISGGTSTESSKTTHFGFRPKAGYFIIDNLPVGLNLSISTYKTKSIGSDNESVSTDITFGPFARYYIKLDKLMPMAELYMSFGASKSKSTYSGSTSEKKYGVVEYGIGAGASYFITDQIAFDMLIGYSSDKYNLKSETSPGGVKSMSAEDSSDKYTGIGINLGVVVTIPN
jgi:outer membrane protein